MYHAAQMSMPPCVGEFLDIGIPPDSLSIYIGLITCIHHIKKSDPTGPILWYTLCVVNLIYTLFHA